MEINVIFSAGVLAFCAQYGLATCSPDAVAEAVMRHLGAPYDQITWCCGTAFSSGEKPTHWELEKPHTMFCDRSVNGLDPSWSDTLGSIYMGHEQIPDYKNYCAIWLHRGKALVS